MSGSDSGSASLSTGLVRLLDTPSKWKLVPPPFFLLSPPSSLPHEQEDQNSAPGKSRKEREKVLPGVQASAWQGTWGQDKNQSSQYREKLRNNLVLQRGHGEAEPVF